MLNSGRIRDQSGVTLIELMIVMVLMGVVGVIVLRGFVSASEITATGTQRADALEDIRPAIQRMTRELRAADPLVISPSLSYATELSAVVHRGGQTFRHSYAVVDGAEPGEHELWEEVYEVAADGTETLSRANQLVILVDGTSDPVFSYLDDAGVPIVCDDLNLSTVDAQLACRGRLVAASQVGIRLTRQVAGQTSGIDIDTTISVRNVRYGS